MDEEPDFPCQLNSVAYVFDKDSASLKRKQFTDYTLWKQLAIEKARIEDQFSNRLRKWISDVNNSVNAILSYKEPNLLKSLQTEMRLNSLRADQAEREAMAYTRFSRHLDRDSQNNADEQFREYLMTYKQLLKSLDRISKEDQDTTEKFDHSITRLNDHMAATTYLNESLHGLTPELHDKFAQVQTKIDKIRTKLQKTKRAKSTLLEEVVKQSDHVMNAWLLVESKKLELLAKEWRVCLIDKRTCVDDLKALESDALKFSEMVAVTEFLDQLATCITKELQISKPNNEVKNSDSLNNVYKNDVETSVIMEISNNAENINSTPRKSASAFSFHRPNAVSDIGSSRQASIEGIECEDAEGTRTFPPQGVHKLFLPELTEQTTKAIITQKQDNPTQKLIPVVAVKSYRKQSSREISLRCGQKLKMCPVGPHTQMAYGLKKCRLTSGEKGGFFPTSYVIQY